MRSRLDGQAGSRRRKCRTPLGDRVSSKGHSNFAGRRQSSRRHYKMRLTLWACTLKSPPNFHGGALADATLRKSPALQVIKTQTQRFPAQPGGIPCERTVVCSASLRTVCLLASCAQKIFSLEGQGFALGSPLAFGRGHPATAPGALSP